MAKQYTGAELEEKGILKFDCQACRDAFPARCDAHPVRNPHVIGKTSRGQLIVRMKPRPQAALDDMRRRSTAMPMLGYTAPYEHLEREIQSALAAHR